MPTTILLIRHGENDWVRSRKLAGRIPAVHLNETGRSQARRVAGRLAAWPIAAVYSSPLERCHETAEIVAAPHRLPLQFEEALLESDYGDWQGQAIEDLTKQDLWKVVQSVPSFAHFPGGESLRAMQYRAVEAVHRIAALHPDQNVIICSHADPIRAVLVHCFGAHLDLYQRIEVAPGSVSIVRFGAHGPRVVCVNDTGDLCPPSPPEKPAEENKSPESHV